MEDKIFLINWKVIRELLEDNNYSEESILKIYNIIIQNTLKPYDLMEKKI